MPNLDETDPALRDAPAILMHNYGPALKAACWPKGVYDTCAQMINAMKAEAETYQGEAATVG